MPHSHSPVTKLRNVAMAAMAAVASLAISAPMLADNSDAIFKTYHEALKEFRADHQHAPGIKAGNDYLAEIEKTDNGRKTNYALILADISYLHDESGNHAQAIDCAAEAAAIIRQHAGQQSQLYLAALTRLANFNAHANRYADAIEAAEQARDILKATGKENTREYSILTGNLATYHSNLENLDTALAMHRQALDIIASTQGQDCKDYADRLGLMANVQLKQGNTAQAIDNMTASLAILENITGRDHRGYMTILNNLAQAQAATGNYVDALLTMADALNICENLFGVDTPQYATYLCNHAAIESRLGKYRDAINTLARALAIQQKIYGDRHADTGITLGSLSACYTSLGEYTEAITLRRQAMEVFENTTGRTSTYYARCLQELANNHYYLGNYAEARKLADMAIDAIAAKTGQNTPDYARALITKAAVESKAGNHAAAIDLDTRIAHILASTLGTENATYATALFNKAEHLRKAGDIDSAINIGEQVLKLRQQILGPLHPDCARSFHNLGGYYAAKGLLRQAEDYTSKGMAIRQSIYGRNNPHYIASLSALCAIEAERQNYAAAAANTLKCNLLITDLIKRSFSDLTSHERSLLWNNYSRWFSSTIPLITFNSRKKPLIQSAYDAMLFSKGLLLNTEIELAQLIAENGDTDALNLYRSIADARRELTKIYELPLGQQKSRTDSLEKSIADREKQLIARSRAYGDYTARLSMSWTAVRDALAPGDVAVEFAAFDNKATAEAADSTHYIAFVVRPGCEAPEMIHITAIASGNTIAPRDKSKSLHLGSVVWKPLANELNDARRIFFAPTGELHAMPLEHMLHWDGSGRSMAQAYDMYRLSSTREIALDDDNQALARATLFGGLTYGTDNTDDTPAMRDTAIPADDDDAFADDDYNLRSAFQPLEGTRVEVSNISRFLAQMGVDYKIYTGTDGTEASFRAMAGNRLNLLHVATHGFYWTEQQARKYRFSGFLNPNRFAHLSDEDKALNRSGILMAGAATNFTDIADNPDPDDGIITSKEIAQLDFRGMNLAVLSACQTALGDITTDGVFGLQRGFKKAGVQSLLMSLWKVDDTATQILMTDFYRNMAAGHSKVKSLALAQQTLRNHRPAQTQTSDSITDAGDTFQEMTPHQRRRANRLEAETAPDTDTRPYADPRFWAAFILLDAIH